MKNYSKLSFLLLLTVSCFCIQCSEDELHSFTEENSAYSKQTSKENVFNFDNPQESYGIMHNEVLQTYLLSENDNESIESIAYEIELLIADYHDGIGIYQANVVNIQDVEAIVQDPPGSFDFILENSCLSHQAQVGFSDFVDELLLISDAEWNAIFSFITLYENAVLSDLTLSPEDKTALLSICSIIRHSIYFGKGRDDGDWITSVGNIAAAVKGACNNGVNAVEYSLITGIALQMLEAQN